MLIVAGEVRMTPESVAKVREQAATMVAETLKEDGCLEYGFAEDLLEPGRIRLFEKWRDQAALDAHFQTPHMAAFNAALAQVELQGVSVKIYEVSGERVLLGD